MSSNTNTDILVAGAFAAFAVDLLIYPLDTIKTRIQSPNYTRTYLHASTNTINGALLFRGVYQGIGSVVIATVPSCTTNPPLLPHPLHATTDPIPYTGKTVLEQTLTPRPAGAFFTTYEALKALLTRLNRPSSSSRHGSNPLIPLPLLHSLASATAELVSCAILTPFEVLKQNAQIIQHLPSSTHHPTGASNPSATLTALSKFRHNPRQLWTGYAALAARNLPFTAMQFPLFEHFRARMHDYRRRRGVATGTLAENGVVTALSAGSAGSIAAVITTPIDVVKTRVMLGAGAGEGQGRGGESRDAEREGRRAGRRGGGTVAVGRQVLRTEGVRGLFRGGALRAVWTAVGMGLYLGVYESGRKWLEGRRKREEKEEGRGVV